MKSLILLSVLFLLNVFACQSDNTKVNTAENVSKTEAKNQNMISYQGKNGDVQYDYKFEVGDSSVKINYKLTNTGKTDYLIFNRGDSARGFQKGLVYAESKDQKTVEISQKSFQEPQNAGCPDRLVPIRAGASWLKAGQTTEESVEIPLPLKTLTPFDDCTRLPQIDGSETAFHFCIGIAPADSQTEIDEKGLIKNWTTIKEQQFLCSENMKLK